MTIQRMAFKKDDGRIHTYNCGVNEIYRGGEFTMCGCAIPDSHFSYLDFEKVGDEYSGNIKKVTCPECKKVINYFKELC